MKSIFTILVLFLTISIAAQSKAEKPAKRLAGKMTEVLVLNDSESKQVYEIQLSKFKQAKAIKADSGDDKEKAKAEKKVLNNKTQKELQAVVGEEKMKQWKKYMKESKK